MDRAPRRTLASASLVPGEETPNPYAPLRFRPSQPGGPVTHRCEGKLRLGVATVKPVVHSMH